MLIMYVLCPSVLVWCVCIGKTTVMPINYCGVHPRRPGVVGPSKVVQGIFFGSSLSPRRFPLLIHYILDCLSRARLFRHPTVFLTAGVFYDSGSCPPQGQRSLTSLFSRRRGSTLSLSVCLSSISPTLP